MKGKLLLMLSGFCVPNNGGTIHACAQNVISTFVPFQGKNWTFMLSQSPFKSTFGKNKIILNVVDLFIYYFSKQKIVKNCHLWWSKFQHNHRMNLWLVMCHCYSNPRRLHPYLMERLARLYECNVSARFPKIKQIFQKGNLDELCLILLGRMIPKDRTLGGGGQKSDITNV